MAVRPYADMVKKLKKGEEADQVKKIATELDASREKGKTNPFKHMPVHAKLLTTKEKELQSIKKNMGKKADKTVVGVIDQMTKEMKTRAAKLKVKPQAVKA